MNNGAELTLNRQLDLPGSVAVFGSTLNVNENLKAEKLSYTGSANLNLAAGVSFDVKDLQLLNGGRYTYDGTDSVRRSFDL